jgi:hypothetical protein
VAIGKPGKPGPWQLELDPAQALAALDASRERRRPTAGPS